MLKERGKLFFLNFLLRGSCGLEETVKPIIRGYSSILGY